jgi:hypothetical protein
MSYDRRYLMTLLIAHPINLLYSLGAL